MYYDKLIYLTILRFRRNRLFLQKALFKVLGLIVMGYILTMLVYLGLYLPDIISALNPNANVVEKLNGGLLFIFVFDLAQRSFFQKLPSIVIKPLLTLPVPKQQLVNYLITTSLAQWSNLLYFLVLIPFVYKTFPLYYEWWQAVLYVSCFVGFIAINHFGMVCIRLLALRYFLFRGLPFGIAILILIAQANKWAAIKDYSEYFFNFTLQYEGIIILTVLIAGIYGLILSAQKLLHRALYFDIL
ncbi:MAG: DUF5687 family protein [Cytophagales bacterium]|nr:DUF5687 family protein [Cytophagales bacterium]